MRRDHAADRGFGAKEMILTDNVVQMLRSQLVREGTRRRIFEQTFALPGARGSRARRAHRTLTAKSWPPRLMPKVQGPWPAVSAFFRSLTVATGL
jgi:hypothetical protein